MRDRFGLTASLERVGISPRDALGLAALALCGLGLSLANGGPISVGLLLVSMVIAVTAPAAIIAAVPFALPFVYDPVPLRGGAYSLLELAIVLAVLAIAPRVTIEVLRSRSMSPITALLRPLPITMAACTLIVVAALSLTWLADARFRAASVRDVRWTVVEPIAALIAFRWLLRRDGRPILIGGFLLMAAGVALYGVVQIATGRGLVIADGAGRATGPYPHPNNLALYLDRPALFLLALSLGWPAARRWAIPAAILVAAGLAATLSRGSVLAYVVGAGWVVYAVRLRHGWRWIAGGIGAAVAALGILASGRLADSGGSGATSSRELIWRAAIRMIQDHPWTGIGPDQFLTQYGRRYIDPAGWPERYTSHPHNLVLDVWLRFGVPGLIVAALLVWSIVRVARRPAAGDVDRRVWIAATGALLAGLAHGMVDNGFFLPDLAVMTWLLVALLEDATMPGMKKAISDE